MFMTERSLCHIFLPFVLLCPPLLCRVARDMAPLSSERFFALPFAPGGVEPHPKPKRTRRPFPSATIQAWCSQGHHYHGPQAIIARLIYRMLKFGSDYIDKGMEAYE